MRKWLLPSMEPLLHGGPDGQGAVRFDFSTNANAAGPLLSVAAAVADADRSRYPDPGYKALREHLAAWHGATPERVVVAGSACEFVHRFTHLAARSRRVQRAVVPSPGYGEYAAAAQAAGLRVVGFGEERPRIPTADDLWWITEPASPSGSTLGDGLAPLLDRLRAAGALVVLDLAYQPLRFDAYELPAQASNVWSLWSPNKSCGLPGVRAAYAIASTDDLPVVEVLRASAPSWVIGAEGVAMLRAFAQDRAQAELASLRPTLRAWRESLSQGLHHAGWQVGDAPSVTPFLVAQPPEGVSAADLRSEGIKLRDTTTLGLRGWMRLSAQRPEAVTALMRALARR
jgi:histidinol-phosphate aminotransferase